MILILNQNLGHVLLTPYSFLKILLVFFIWHPFAFLAEDIKNKIKLGLMRMICFLSNSVVLLLAVHLSLFTMFAMLLFARTKVTNYIYALVDIGVVLFFFLYSHSCYKSSFIIKLVKLVSPEKVTCYLVRLTGMSLKSV